MLWLCLRLPQLPLVALPPLADDPPEAVIDRNLVLLANSQAQQYGVAPGQSFQTAQSLCAQLVCRERQPLREAQLLHNMALWAYRFSGHVSICPETAIVLELSRSLRLFRNLNRLYKRFIHAFRQRELQVCTAVANTPLAAELLSHQNPALKTLVDGRGALKEAALKAALQGLPVHCLPLPDKDRQRLAEMGLHTLGQLLPLPRRALQIRFGSTLAEVLARLLGDVPDPRDTFRPAEYFSGSRYIDSGLNNHQQLRFPIAALLGDLQHYLRLRQCVNRDLNWQLDYLDGRREQWHQPLSHRHFDKRSVLELVMLDLAQRQLSGPVCGVHLHSHQFVTPAAEPDGLFCSAGARRDHDLPRLLDTLQLRLQAHQCSQYLPTDNYLPEQLQPYHLAEDLLNNLLNNLPSNQQHPHQGTPSAGPLRPTWLLEPAVPLYQREGQLFWRGTMHLLQGPERIDSQWWRQRQVRDYYIAQHQDGRLCWLYRDCLQPGWYLHGLFG